MDLCETTAGIAGRTFEASYYINGDSIVVVSDLGIGRGEIGAFPMASSPRCCCATSSAAM